MLLLLKNEVRVRFAGSLPSLLLKIEQKGLLHWFQNIVLHTYQLLKRQNRTIIKENTRRTGLPCFSAALSCFRHHGGHNDFLPLPCFCNWWVGGYRLRTPITWGAAAPQTPRLYALMHGYPSHVAEWNFTAFPLGGACIFGGKCSARRLAD